jgi:LmbE family N-acetylglucosaminyl deacetylase
VTVVNEGAERVLVVVAHPDDEVLGMGATAALLTAKGATVTACILSGHVDARRGRPAVGALREQMLRAQEILGMQQPIVAGFPNIRFNTVPHIELVRSIEEALRLTSATVVFTHHPHDVNDDHRATSMACQAAARLFQREGGGGRLAVLAYMETLSSTDWSFEHAHPFVANSFVGVGLENVERKIEALSAYKDVMRPYPHPRSSESLVALATYRGGQCGMPYAEAFQSVYTDLGLMF